MDLGIEGKVALVGGAPPHRDVDASDSTHIRRDTLSHDAGSKLTLNLHSFCCGDVPQVQVEGLHTTIIASGRRGRNRCRVSGDVRQKGGE